MAEQYLIHVERPILRTEEIKRLYSRATTNMIVMKVEPWTVEQLEESRQRQQLEMAAQAYLGHKTYGKEVEMAEQYAIHATLRTPATINTDAALKVALAVIENRKNGRPQGITGFTRGDEWTSKDAGEGGAKSAQRALKAYFEANGFTVASTTKQLNARVAPLEIMSREEPTPVKA